MTVNLSEKMQTLLDSIGGGLTIDLNPEDERRPYLRQLEAYGLAAKSRDGEGHETWVAVDAEQDSAREDGDGDGDTDTAAAELEPSPDQTPKPKPKPSSRRGG